MDCGPLMIWDPVPVRSRFCARASGDVHKFNASISVDLDGVEQPQFRHNDLVGDGACLTFDTAGQCWTLIASIVLTSKPDQAVLLEAWIEDSDGHLLKFETDQGTEEAKCEWRIKNPAASPLTVEITIVTV